MQTDPFGMCKEPWQRRVSVSTVFCFLVASSLQLSLTVPHDQSQRSHQARCKVVAAGFRLSSTGAAKERTVLQRAARMR